MGVSDINKAQSQKRETENFFYVKTLNWEKPQGELQYNSQNYRKVLGVLEFGMVEGLEVLEVVEGISSKSPSLLTEEVYLYTTELLVWVRSL